MSWLSRMFGKRKREAELDEEVRSHLEMAAREGVERGANVREAKQAARREFGNVELVKEATREMWNGRRLAEFLEDARYGLRRMWMAPGFTAIAVLVLALGIGANTAIFSLVNEILLEALPYPNAARLVSVAGGAYPKGAVAAMREQMKSMDTAAYVESQELNLTGLGEAVRLTGTPTSAELFSILGARTEMGRTFETGEDAPGQDGVVILSHALWEQQFARDPNILDRSIALGGMSRRVIGVMPADFRFPSNKTQVWIPLHNDPRDTVNTWAGDFMPCIGRLKEGATLEQAQTEIRMFQSRVGALFPWPMPATWNSGVSVVPLSNGMVADVRGRLLILLGAVALVLLIACSNVANLTLARSATREKEISLRAALGASRLRIARQLLTESVMQALAGGLLGLLFARGGLALLKTILPAETPRLAETNLDWRVLAFAAALAIVTGIVFGLAPALHSSRVSAAEGLKAGGKGSAVPVSRRLRSALAAAQVALAVLLVIASGLLIRSFWAISHSNPGFQAAHVVTARLTPNKSFCDDVLRCLAFYRGVVEQARSIPGIQGAALENTLPLDGRVGKRPLDVEGFTVPAGQNVPLFWLNVVTPDYFRVMGISLREGRAFTEADTNGAPTAIVTEETARRFWPNQQAVGKHVRLFEDKEWREVIGVIPDVRAYDMQTNAPQWVNGTAYVPYNATATLEDRRIPSEMSIVLRTASEDPRIGDILRSRVTALNPEVPVSEVKTMGTVVSEAIAAPASTTVVMAVFAGLALLLGTIGIYGVLSFLVASQTREIGIRMALGATRRDVLRSVMGEGAKLALTGIALGMAGALAAMRILSGQLYGVSATDPLTFLAVAGVVAIVSMVACYVPARRAMSVDPVVALRYE